ncbi:MAG: hypothetical protein ACRD23_03890 [Terriglobales bacterium]
MTLNKRFSRRFQGQINYTYAKSTDDLLNSNLGLGVGQQGGGGVPTDNNNLEFDRGNSDLFVPHVFVASGIYELPLGFHFSSVFRATSGVYFSAAGNPIDYDGDGISSTRPPGTKRNQFRGPSAVNLDLRIEKGFRFADRYSISPLAEFFNITNQANPELVDNAWIYKRECQGHFSASTGRESTSLTFQPLFVMRAVGFGFSALWSCRRSCVVPSQLHLY